MWVRGTCSHWQGVGSSPRGDAVMLLCGGADRASALCRTRQRWRGQRAVPLVCRCSNQTVAEARIEQGAHGLVSLGKGGAGWEIPPSDPTWLRLSCTVMQSLQTRCLHHPRPCRGSQMGVYTICISPLERACCSEKITGWFA